MTALRDVPLEDVPSDIAARLDELIEVAPGVVKCVRDCTLDDAVGSLESSVETEMDRQECLRLIRSADAGALPDGIGARVNEVMALRRDPDPRVFRDQLRALRDDLRPLVADDA